MKTDNDFGMRVVVNAITQSEPTLGSRVYLWSLCPELVQLGVDLILLVRKGQAGSLPSHLRCEAAEISVPGDRSYWQVFYQPRIKEALRRLRPHVYHVPNTQPLFRTCVPSVITIHDLADLRVRKYGLVRTSYRSVVNRVAARSADHIITVSENSKRDIIDLLGVSDRCVSVVHCGVGKQFRRLDKSDCKRELAARFGVSGDFLLFPGGLSRNKNLESALRAVRILRNSGVPSQLVVTGDLAAPESRLARDAVAAMELDTLVTFAGFVEPAELPKFYNACSAVLYPSLYEGFGLPVVEAMACGAPLIASNASSIPEVAQDAALFVDPADPADIAQAVRRLLADPALRNHLSMRGLERAAAFSWRTAAIETLKVYDRVASGRPPGSAVGHLNN